MTAPPAPLSAPAGGPSRVGLWCRYRWVELLAIVVYTLLTVVGALKHELWRDEMRAWSLATRPASVAQMFVEINTDGHPGLWYLLLRGVGLGFSDPIAMQLLQVLLAVVTAALLLFRAPFPRWQRLLFLAGYFPLFEYALVARNYALTFTLLFAICAGWCRWHRHFVWLLLLLAVMTQTSVFGLLMAGSLTVGVLLDIWHSQDAAAQRMVRSLVLVGVMGALALGTLLMLVPAEQTVGLRLSSDRLIAGASLLGKAMVPFPARFRDPWEVYYPSEQPITQLALSLLGLVAVVFLLRRDWRQLIVFLLLLSGMFVVCLALGTAAARHTGHLFLALVALVWIARERRPAPASGTHRRRGDELMFAALLAVQIPGGVNLWYQDYRRPFSGAAETARFIAQHYPQLPVCLDWYPAGESLAGYLQRPVLFLRTRHVGFYNRNNLPIYDGRLAVLTDQVCRSASDLARPFLLVLSYPQPPPATAHCSIDWLFSSDPHALRTDEIFHVYLVSPPPAAAARAGARPGGDALGGLP